MLNTNTITCLHLKIEMAINEISLPLWPTYCPIFFLYSWRCSVSASCLVVKTRTWIGVLFRYYILNLNTWPNNDLLFQEHLGFNMPQILQYTIGLPGKPTQSKTFLKLKFIRSNTVCLYQTFPTVSRNLCRLVRKDLSCLSPYRFMFTVCWFFFKSGAGNNDYTLHFFESCAFKGIRAGVFWL